MEVFTYGWILEHIIKKSEYKWEKKQGIYREWGLFASADHSMLMPVRALRIGYKMRVSGTIDHEWNVGWNCDRN